MAFFSPYYIIPGIHVVYGLVVCHLSMHINFIQELELAHEIISLLVIFKRWQFLRAY